MEKQKEHHSHSNINCGTLTKNVTLKVRRSLKPQWPSVVTRGTDIAIGQVFLRISACLVLSLRLPGSLSSDDPIDRQLLTADPHTNFHRANEMRTTAQRALFKQNSARAVQAAGIRTSQISTERRHQCGRHDHGVAQQQFDWKKRMDWTRCRGSSGHQREHRFWISMRGCLLKCSSEQVLKATDAEWLGAELRAKLWRRNC